MGLKKKFQGSGVQRKIDVDKTFLKGTSDCREEIEGEGEVG